MTQSIQHIVMLNLRADAAGDELADIMSGLAVLRSSVPGFVAFQHGPNYDLEQKSQHYSYGFICSFADKHALQSYAENPHHQALGARLVALCNGGADGIWVADIAVGERAM